jgi:diaminohydroxyphosphoribosylaminopyrimidine deaminase / 5-amino-6-(5-phosphoribosylamino)uracil reductase
MTNHSDFKMYMQRCIDIAGEGLGNTSPNPMVGSVIVHHNKIIGEGYHKKCGGPHAEVNAINSVKNKALLNESTLFVNLEPCSHYGKTPPCADLIIKSGIKRVVISNVDPNPQVQGKGIEKLKSAGVEVFTGILEHEGEILNRRFFTFQRKRRPYIILKWAQTSDGFIDYKRDVSDIQKAAWITNNFARILVHKWRTVEDAIMVGTTTAIKDNPTLNVRDWVGKNPVRIVPDRNLRLNRNLNLMNGMYPTIVFTSPENKTTPVENVTFIPVVFDNHAPSFILDEMYKMNIQSLIIEGGSALLKSFINAGLWDEARVFVGNKMFMNGIKAPSMPVPPDFVSNGDDYSLYEFKNI